MYEYEKVLLDIELEKHSQHQRNEYSKVSQATHW
jgi:hypothetical protein